jgi:hypothetical protein
MKAAAPGPAITTRPTGTNFNRGDTVTLSVIAESTGPITYQWYQNKIAVPGATGATLTIQNADHRAVGDYYVRVTNDNGSVDTLPDDSCRVLMHGAYVIEAEDFNFNRGQSMPVASVMPYTGNAYLSVTSQVVDVDFFNTEDESGDFFVYRTFLGEEVVAIKGPGDPADHDRGDFTMTVNYAVGWTDAGEWQNYTRNFTMGNYVILAGVAYYGYAAGSIDMFLSQVADPTREDGSQPGVEGNQQGVTRLGSFKAGGTGAWSSNDLIPLRDDAGNIVKVPLSGTRTLRWSANKSDGDMDYLLLYNVDHGDPPPSSIARTPTGATITFSGTLQSASTISGTFTDVPGATSPYPVTTTGAQQFYRSKQ